MLGNSIILICSTHTHTGVASSSHYTPQTMHDFSEFHFTFRIPLTKIHHETNRSAWRMRSHCFSSVVFCVCVTPTREREGEGTCHPKNVWGYLERNTRRRCIFLFREMAFRVLAGCLCCSDVVSGYGLEWHNKIDGSASCWCSCVYVHYICASSSFFRFLEMALNESCVLLRCPKCACSPPTTGSTLTSYLSFALLLHLTKMTDYICSPHARQSTMCWRRFQRRNKTRRLGNFHFDWLSNTHTRDT